MEKQKRQNEIENAVRAFVGDNISSVDVCMVGKIAYIEVSYFDFLPEKVVRSALEKCIKDSVVRVAERMYSDEAVKDELMKMYEEGMVCGDVPIYEIVEERLFNKSLS